MSDTDPTVVSSHIIDDLTTALATARRALADVAWALDIATDANRDGHPDIVAEYLDRTLATVATARAATTDTACLPR